MGASLSVSGHFTHREGRHHRLKHVASNEEKKACGMCAQPVELGEPFHRCRGCAFVLHDGCYRRPNKITHFAHSCSGRPLTLTDVRTVASPAGRRRSCNICAVAFDNDGFVYGCNKCGGFYAHPRCCGLPQTVHNHALHPNHPLTLLPPPANDGEHRRGSRRCINRAGGCSNAKRLDSAAWSYQCNQCGVELCLACQLPGGGGAQRRHGGGGHHHLHVDLETLVPVAERVANAMGTILHGFCCTLCLGAPGAPSPMPQPATNK